MSTYVASIQAGNQLALPGWQFKIMNHTQTTQEQRDREREREGEETKE